MPTPNRAAWGNPQVITEENSQWTRGGKVHVVRYRLVRWENLRYPSVHIRTMETLYGRSVRIDRNKYLPDGSNNPMWDNPNEI